MSESGRAGWEDAQNNGMNDWKMGIPFQYLISSFHCLLFQFLLLPAPTQIGTHEKEHLSLPKPEMH
jgi:hypothetical protein